MIIMKPSIPHTTLSYATFGALHVGQTVEVAVLYYTPYMYMYTSYTNEVEVETAVSTLHFALQILIIINNHLPPLTGSMSLLP